ATVTLTNTPTATATATGMPNLTITVAPTGTPILTATATLSLPTSTPTPTSTPYPQPNVGVQTARMVTPGRLQVTVTARDAACNPNNALVSLHFIRTDNATVDVGPLSGQSGDFIMPLQGQAQLTF